jgi:hypothetical protein
VTPVIVGVSPERSKPQGSATEFNHQMSADLADGSLTGAALDAARSGGLSFLRHPAGRHSYVNYSRVAEKLSAPDCPGSAARKMSEHRCSLSASPCFTGKRHSSRDVLMQIGSFPNTQIELACSKCSKRGSFAKERYNLNMTMPQLLSRLTRDCPWHGLAQNQCEAFFPQIGGTGDRPPFAGFRSNRS